MPPMLIHIIKFLKSGIPQLDDVQLIENYKEQAQIVLGYYLKNHYSEQCPTSRYGRLLLLLATMRSISQPLIEKLFFSDIIGSQIRVKNLLWKLYSISNTNK